MQYSGHVHVVHTMHTCTLISASLYMYVVLPLIDDLLPIRVILSFVATPGGLILAHLSTFNSFRLPLIVSVWLLPLPSSITNTFIKYTPNESRVSLKLLLATITGVWLF